MCAEVALNEAVSQMTPCEAWSTTLARLFQCINTCITQSKETLKNFPRDKLLSLTLNIIKVIEASIYSSDNSLEPPLATAYPWTLLYKIIKHNEKDESVDIETVSKAATAVPPVTTGSPASSIAAANNSDSNLETSSVASDMPVMPASLQFMHTAHDHLGRRSWCCNNDGSFLILYVEALTTELAKPSVPAKEELVRDLEQCFLCLYGHPSKKAKARGLQEHNSCQIPLTWDNSAVVFDYFKPRELPTFDSKIHTISAEVQNLMRRITLVVPQLELEAITFDSVQAFIEGTSEEIPKLPERLLSKKRPVISELFYLLADFYFKNKEFSKALKFYTHDICVQPQRSDSWAAMALARKSRLENKLNACEPKSEGPIQKHSIAALRCFKRAMETDSTNSSILEEYGSLCYFLHSHASRQLKQFDQVDAADDTRSSLSQRRQDMLLLSEKCFTTALGMEDSEAWLHHYMLGKIAEKLRKPPQVYLTHYEKSAKYLDEDIQTYPRKIPFYSPPDHVLEALEVYYRIHVSILKLVLNKFHDLVPSLLVEYLQRAANGPFYQPEYDVESSHSGLYRTESTTSDTFNEAEPSDNSDLGPVRSSKSGSTLPTITEPTLATSTEPTQATITEPAQATITEPTLATITDPTPSIIVEPTLATITEPTLATITEPTLATITEPTQATIIEPTPATINEPNPSTIVGPTLATITEPTQAIITEPTLATINEPILATITAPTLATFTEPTLATITEPTLGTITDPTLGTITDPTLGTITEPTPATITEPTPSTIKEPTPSTIKEPTPATITEPTPAAITEQTQTTITEQSDAKHSTDKSEALVQRQRSLDPVNVNEECTGDVDVQSASEVKADALSVAMETDEGHNLKETSNDVIMEVPLEQKGEEGEKVGRDVAMDTQEVASSVAMETTPVQDKSATDEVMKTSGTGEGKSTLSGGGNDSEKNMKEGFLEQSAVETTSECVTEIAHDIPRTKNEGEVMKKDKQKAYERDSSSAQISKKEDEISKDDRKETETSQDLETKKHNDAEAEERMEVETKEMVEGHEDHAAICVNEVEDKGSTSSLSSEQKVRQKELMDRCLRAIEHCLRRFPQHHKSRYRLAYIAYYSEAHKDLTYSRELLLGTGTTKPKPGRPVHQGLFNEKSKTNMFSAFWRIPEEDIDRPGSFCTHTYKSVDLLLRVLRETKEWDTLLLVSNLLYLTPVAGKKFLRDNERHFQARRALDHAMAIMTERVDKSDIKDGKQVLTQLVLDAHECWKVGQKNEIFAKVTENLLSKSYGMLKACTPLSSYVSDSGDSPSLLEQALRFCQQTAKPQILSTSSSAQSTAESSVDSQADLSGEQDPTLGKPIDSRMEPTLAPNQSSVSVKLDAASGSSMEVDTPKTPSVSVESTKQQVSEKEDTNSAATGVPISSSADLSAGVADIQKKDKKDPPPGSEVAKKSPESGVAQRSTTGQLPMEIDPPVTKPTQSEEQKNKTSATECDATTSAGIPIGFNFGPTLNTQGSRVTTVINDDELKSSREMQKTASDAIKMFANLVPSSERLETPGQHQQKARVYAQVPVAISSTAQMRERAAEKTVAVSVQLPTQKGGIPTSVVETTSAAVNPERSPKSNEMITGLSSGNVPAPSGEEKHCEK